MEKSFIYYAELLFLTYVLWIFNGNVVSDLTVDDA